MAQNPPQGPAGSASERPFSFQPSLDAHAAQQLTSRIQTDTQQPPSSYHAPTQLQTSQEGWSGYPEQRFSYMDTPIDEDTQTFDDERQAAIMQEARARFGDAQPPQMQEQHQAQPQLVTQPQPVHQGLPTDPSHYPPEKQQVHRMPSAYQLPPPPEPHPAHAAPYVQDEQKVRTDFPQQHPAYQEPPYSPHSPGPLPSKHEEYAKSSRASQSTLTSPQFALPPTSNSPAPFSPYGAAAPDLDAHHRPGQIPHPSMKHSKGGDQSKPVRPNTAWHYGLCACPGSDLSTCFLGLVCPCILYSRLTYRLGQRSRKQDPTDVLGFHKCNGHCMGFGLLCPCGLSGLLATITRGRVRHSYDVDGGVGSDLIEGCCCCCCAIIQGEREVRIREQEKGRWAGPASGVDLDPYKRVGSMAYPSGAPTMS